jgi:uncharacterized membrane protein (DUF441 family)
VKLSASTLNTVGLTILGAAVLLPLVAGQLQPYGWVWIIVAAGLHFLAQALLRTLRSED